MSSKNLDQWLAYIEACHPQEIDLGLERIKKVARVLGLTSLNCPVVTVAGTNGKGSTIAYMAEVLSQAGYRFGCYTSPHFLRYNERIVTNGRPVEDKALCDAFCCIEIARESLAVALTYFEYGTLAALILFKRAELDVVLLEIGLGGRLDAVNIIDPDIAIVTTVAIDHESWLGSDREQIGFEKAGVYRPDRPALYGEKNIPGSVLKHAETIAAKLYHWGDQFAGEKTAECWQWRGRDNAGGLVVIDDISYPTLPFENASTAIQALKLLNLNIDNQSIRDGIAAATLTGRCQRIVINGREVILDVAHNPHAAIHLVEQLANVEGAFHAVIGMLADKDIASTLEQLKRRVNHWYPATLKVARGQDGLSLQLALTDAGVNTGLIYPADSVVAAFDQALKNSAKGDKILVVGSFVTVAQVLEYLGDEHQ
ncbi:MAG: bifunctional tetrahydrofolate synthase/dihydrofolate synthase [Motiliproteus sp.]